MARLSDIIENIIKDMIEENDGSVEITRGDLANQLNCVPSQITYVLSTRFTNGQGYMVESRRGGGGWIRIKRIMQTDNKTQYVLHTLNSIGKLLTQHQVEVFLTNFVDYKIVELNTAKLIQAATSDLCLRIVPIEIRDELRMRILKQMLLQDCISEEN